MRQLSEVGAIIELVVKDARDAFVGADQVGAQWRDLRFTAAPDFARAVDEYDRFLDLVGRAGASIRRLPSGQAVGLDSIYVRDASIETPLGMVLCGMGKPQRAGEPAAQECAFRDWAIPIAGAIQEPGQLEGGDLVWLNPQTVAVGRGYRTNDSGIDQLRSYLGNAVETIVVPLPHGRGPADVFHLMSMLSPVDRDLALVYSPLLPVPFRERLLDLGYQLVEVPDDEFASMGANVLAVAPRRCVAVAGNPLTRALLECAHAEVLVYAGTEISLKGGGGPTCLTRPIARDAPAS